MKKAKEYYDLYKNRMINPETVNQAISGLITDLNNEVEELKQIRHVKYDHGFLPILKEMNQKWNAIVRLFEKEFGKSPIIRDGYRIFIIKQIPELQDKI